MRERMWINREGFEMHTMQQSLLKFREWNGSTSIGHSLNINAYEDENVIKQLCSKQCKVYL